MAGGVKLVILNKMSLLPHLSPVFNQIKTLGGSLSHRFFAIPTSHKVIVVCVFCLLFGRCDFVFFR